MVKHRVHDVRPIDYLRMSDAEHRRLAAALDAQAVTPNGPDRRIQRVPYLVPCGINVRVRQPGGSDWQYYLIRPRNLSPQGMAFFHGGYLHNKTYCEVSLRRRDGSTVACTGEVVHCRFITGRIHEVGLCFHHPIDLRLFVRTSEAPEMVVAVGPVRGSILCADDSLEDRALLKFQLSEMGATVQEAANIERLLHQVRSQRFDIVILGQSLGRPGAELAAAVRKLGYTGPIIQWADVDRPADWAQGLLTKPFGPDQIQSLLRTHLPAGQPARMTRSISIPSTLWPQYKMRSLILQYLDTLEEQTMHLQHLADEQDVAGQIVLVRQIRGSAGSYGYPAISEAIATFLAVAQHEPTQATSHLQLIIDLCQRACAFRGDVDCERDLAA